MSAFSYHYVGTNEDSLVWEKFRTGDQTALGRIYRKQYNALVKYGLSLVQDEELVEDCIQNLFEKLWLCRDRLGSILVIKPYLFKSLRHHIIDQLTVQKQKSQFLATYFEKYTVTVSCEETLIAEQSREEQRKKLLNSLGLLSKRQREAVYLKTFEELEYDKISEVMLLNQQSIRNLIHQAVKTLKNNRSQLAC